jgi:protein-L-isoaspartate(D-aspartate) O-methyltransferase
MTVHAPILDFVAARRAMIENQLRPQGVTDHGVIAAMSSIARESFVDEGARALAYADRSVLVGEGRFMPSPTALGQLLTQMMPEPKQRALVVGAGSGYSAAVLAHIGLEVTALEENPALAARARQAGLNVAEGPLAGGHKRGAPYDQILIDGAVEYIPDALVQQLAEGGRLGGALVERGVSRLIVGRKAAGAFGHLSIGDAGVAALPGFTRAAEFTF